MRGFAYILSMAMVVLASCSKESAPDAAADLLDSSAINFTAYSSAISTKAPVIDNTSIKINGFNVGAYMPNSDLTAAELYIPCTHVVCGSDGTTWGYVDDDGNPKTYYWPALESRKLSFLAHYPKGIEAEMEADDGETTLFGNEKYEAGNDGNLAFSFGYTVHHDAEKQFDLIYALRENVSCPAESPYSVHLPFCHALTQVGFTAELDPDLDVNITVYDVVIHNILYTGTFVVKEDTSDFYNNGVWYSASSTAADADTDSNGYLISEFGVAMLGDGLGVELTSISQDLTDPNDALMLMPQYITAWDPANFVGDDPTEAGTYLAISCEITQTVDDELITIHKKEKWLYAPLTTNITYPDNTLANGGYAATSSDWVAGHKITYNLKFGGGYSTVPGSENPVMTLSPLAISASVEEWEDVDGGELMSDENATEQ
ncbi:MAG: fimbrillin family protein [Rikenellaceae bacterium]